MIRIKISELLGAKKWSQRKLSRESGISTNTILKLYHESSRVININDLNALCKAFKCRVSDIIEYIPDDDKK